jgi:hypothetical protein
MGAKNYLLLQSLTSRRKDIANSMPNRKLSGIDLLQKLKLITTETRSLL